jgi:hypothetical protein
LVIPKLGIKNENPSRLNKSENICTYQNEEKSKKVLTLCKSIEPHEKSNLLSSFAVRLRGGIGPGLDAPAHSQ